MTTYGSVIWITGLSGAGKTSVAHELALRIRARREACVVLDGDRLRAALGASGTTADLHSREARVALSFQYARLCSLLAEQGLTVIIATISMFKEIYAWNRVSLPGYVEIFLRVPIEVLRRRDPKGIYERYDRGEITQVAGLDLVVDQPLAPDLLFDYEPRITPEKIARQIDDFISHRAVS
ncbi:MAG: adenylyl-sulfate kinase [Alphaproteobacteria bacterium]|nr:adenylyl-sulfate kinase [Alphaproteobacteria bacterium]